MADSQLILELFFFLITPIRFLLLLLSCESICVSRSSEFFEISLH